MNTFLLAAALVTGQAKDAQVSFEQAKDHLDLKIAGKPFARYVYRDDKIHRPYFMHVHAPGGLQVTRNHPPRQGIDDVDHATFHLGVWLSFADLGGGDYWRNLSVTEHIGFEGKPEGGEGRGGFTVHNRYVKDKEMICEEKCRYRIIVRPSGYLLLWDSSFRGGKDFWFGDQEEMGLGVRVATPLAVKKGGTILNSEGQTNEKGAWGKQAEWAMYMGKVNGQAAGVLIMPHPDNFRPSWFHARDYGLLVANPFGRNAFTKAAPSKVVVKAGETVRLRFAVLFFSGDVDAAPELRETSKFWQAK